MAESSLEGFSDRARLRRALAHRLSEVQPDLRIVAEGFLAETSVIDLLAVGAEGELVSIRFAKPDDDRATLTRALADLTWLRARRADFLKLSPGLGIDPSAEPRALVVSHGFSAESLAAADNFPENTVALWCCRGLLTETRQILVMEPMSAKLRTTPWRESLSATSPKAPTEQATTPPAVSGRPTRDRPTPSSTLPPTLPHLPTRPVPTGPLVAPTAAGSPPDPRGAFAESLAPAQSGRSPGAPSFASRPATRRSLADPPSPSAFRSGLVDADLDPHGRHESERFHTLDADVD